MTDPCYVSENCQRKMLMISFSMLLYSILLTDFFYVTIQEKTHEFSHLTQVPCELISQKVVYTSPIRWEDTLNYTVDDKYYIKTIELDQYLPDISICCVSIYNVTSMDICPVDSRLAYSFCILLIWLSTIGSCICIMCYILHFQSMSIERFDSVNVNV